MVAAGRPRPSVPHPGQPDPTGRVVRSACWSSCGRFATSSLRSLWPNRPEVVKYTLVVFVTLVFMTSLVFSLDYGFAKGVLWLFGS